MLTFGTLGPSGSNHDWVARRYLAFHRLDRAGLALYDDFDAAFRDLLGERIQHVIQAAVHPSVTGTVARLRGRAHVIDSFVSPSQAMAILTRSEIERPSSLGLQMATRDYADISRWQRLVGEETTIAVARGLLEGRYDSGLTLSRIADEHPGRFRIEETIGRVVDPWLVYGLTPTCRDDLLAWPDSPAARLYRQGLEM